MSLYGYARVSTLDQDLSIQRTALKAAGCEVIRAEKASGARRDGRTELQVLLDFLRAGDTLVVTRIDRLARSLKDLQDIVHELKAKGIALKATEQPVDTGTAAGKAFLDMLGVFAEFETNLRRERQLEGISAAKARGVYKGRKPSIDAVEVMRLRCEEKLGPAAIRAPARHWSGERLSRAEQAGHCRQPKRGCRCRSDLRCGVFIPATGRRSVDACASSVLAPVDASDRLGADVLLQLPVESSAGNAVETGGVLQKRRALGMAWWQCIEAASQVDQRLAGNPLAATLNH
jgi:DNA invertase Pin-like site-specific DNA recombinase